MMNFLNPKRMGRKNLFRPSWAEIQKIYVLKILVFCVLWYLKSNFGPLYRVEVVKWVVSEFEVENQNLRLFLKNFTDFKISANFKSRFWTKTSSFEYVLPRV